MISAIQPPYQRINAMTESLDPSRRRLIKFLSGAPLLPLAGGSAASMLLSACGGDNIVSPTVPTAPVTLASATFSPMAAPGLADAAKMATTTVASSLSASYSDGSKQSYALKYDTFFVTGAQVPNGAGGTILSGGYYDINNKPILDKTEANQRQFFSDCPDGTSLLKLASPTVGGVTGNTVFAVVQFEYATRNVKGDSMYGMLPSPIAVLTLDQDKSTGALKLVKYHNVDTSGVNGLWITCGASRSPWNTHLSSEEYEPDATVIGTNTQFAAFSQNLYGDPAKANPYHYGHLPEVTVNPDGTGSIKKHYCMGRISHELVQVMPDERTALMGDDATNGGLFMFVADKAQDLSSGTLYVAKWAQKTTDNGGSADLSWIKLGKATSAEIPDRPAEGSRYRQREDQRSGGRQLHQDCVQRQKQLGQVHARPGEGGSLPGDPPLRRVQGRQHGLHQDGRHDRQRQGQDRLFGHELHPGGHDQWFGWHFHQGPERGRGVCAEPERRPEGRYRRGHRQRMGASRHGGGAGPGGRGSGDARCAGQPGQSGQDRQSGQHQVLGEDAHAVHRRGQRSARE
jgi:hypothetical protein